MMKNSSSKYEEELGGVDDHDHNCEGSGPFININVSHAPSTHHISLPAHSTFGHLKEVIRKQIGVEPTRQKILFRGKEKDDDGEYLHEAGVKDKAKVLLLEIPIKNNDQRPEEIKECGEGSSKEREEMPKRDEDLKEREEMSKASQAIALVREEVDKLAERVSALEVVVNSGTKVADEEFVVSSELLMRQLLKLDAVEAEGEAKTLRKAEVRRVQNFHELLDNLKSSNSNPFGNKSTAVSVTTEWETFESGVESSSSPPAASSTRVTQDWERFD